MDWNHLDEFFFLQLMHTSDEIVLKSAQWLQQRSHLRLWLIDNNRWKATEQEDNDSPASIIHLSTQDYLMNMEAKYY